MEIEHSLEQNGSPFHIRVNWHRARHGAKWLEKGCVVPRRRVRTAGGARALRGAENGRARTADHRDVASRGGIVCGYPDALGLGEYRGSRARWTSATANSRAN